MSKNLTRKGLALSAVVALGTSLFAGAPAQAAAALNIAPTAGTSYTVLASDSFSVKAFGNAEFSVVTATALRFKVTLPSLTATQVITDGNNAANAGVTDTVDGRVLYVDPVYGTDVAGGNTLTINPVSSTATDLVYKIQAYIESDTTVGLGAGELASAEQTITFSGTAVPTVTLDTVGTGVVTGKVTYTPAINYEQTTTSLTRVLFTVNGVDDDAATNTSARNTDSLSFTSAGAINNPSAGDVVSVVAKTTRYDGDTTYATSASASGSTETATATAVENTITSTANLTKNNSATNWYVRKGTTSFSFVSQFKKGTVAVPAGQPVSIVVTESSNSLTDPDAVKVNGKAVSNTTGLTLNTVTGADGKVTVTVESAYGAENDEFTIAVTSGTASSNTITFKYVVPTLAAALKEVTSPLVADSSAFTRTIVRNGTLAVSYALVDNFGEKWTSANTASTYRAYLSRKSGDTGTASWSTVQADFVNGVASATITDNSIDNTGYRVSVDVYRSQNGTGAWTADTSITSLDLRLKPVTSLSTASKISLGEAKQGSAVVAKTDGTISATAARTTATLSRFDARVESAKFADLAVLAAHSTLVTGVVKRADGGVVPGASVTLASPKLYFSADSSGSKYVIDGSITVVADENGKYSVYVFTTVAGTHTIAITSGAATASQKIKFAAADANTGSAITITAPEYSTAGRSVDVVVALTDKYGAPVQSTSASPLRVSVTGAGSYTTIAADSDADGLVSFKLIFGANETGVATIKATYDLENDGTIDVTKTATVTIGSAPAAAATAAVAGSTGKFFVSATAAAGKSVVVKVAGKFVTSFKATGSKKSVAVKSSKGSKKVTVFVGGKLVATKTVTVK